MDRVTWTDDAQPRELTLGKLLYNLRTDTSGDPDLLMDAVTMDDLMQDPDIEQILMLDALVVEVGMMQRKMEQLMAVMTAAGKTVQPTGMEIGEPVRSRGVVQVPVLFPMSDGQTVAVWFHNPDATPAKLTPMDMLTSWRWMVNKKDVTIAAAPERGADLQPRIVARRIMAIVEKNSPAFTRANAKAAEKAGQIEVLKGEVGALEVRKAGLKRDVEIAREESLARGMAKTKKRAEDPIPLPAAADPEPADLAAEINVRGPVKGAASGIAIASKARVRDEDGNMLTRVTLSDGSVHDLQRSDSTSTMGVPGWHVVRSNGRSMQGESGTYRGDTEAQAVDELVRLLNNAAPPASPAAEAASAPAVAADTGTLTPKYKPGDRLTPDLDVFEGDIVRYDGKLWMAKVKRGTTVPLAPMVDGRPQVSADTVIRVDLLENTVTHTGANFYGYGGQPKDVADPAAPAAVQTPESQISPAIQTTLKPLPPRIAGRVTQAIESLNDAKSQLDTARTGLDENPKIGGGGRYESEVWQKVQGRVAKANDDLQKLRELGNQNGQIASLEALITSLGGVPDVKPSEKALAWTTSPAPAAAPAPAAGLTTAQRKKISDEIARTEAMLAKEYKISTDLQKPVAIGWYESHIANLSDVLNGRMSLAEIDASEREKIEDWDTTRAVFEARAAGATGAEPAAAAPAPEQPSTQFQNYANWLRKQAAEGKAVPETFWQQVAMDERLNDGEADALKAEHAAPAAPPASDPITEPPAADLFGEAPQAFQTQPVALTPEGAESKVKTAKGTEVVTGYSVVEADHLITSHNPSTGDANPAFPAELQPRDRGRDASIAWVKKTAQNLDPDLLGKSRRADSGAPIVGPDGVVESGNGRTMAVVLAYQSGKADDYRAWLEEEAGYFGLKPEKVKAMKRPVLVRIRTSKVDRAAFAIEANQSDTLAMTATEKAKSDARRLDDGMIALMTENGDLAAAENVPFLSAFLRSLGESEAAQYSTTDGKPTSTLIARVQAAIFAKAYADDRLLELTADTAKPEIANIVKALNHAAPEFIQAAAMDPDATSAATGKLTDAVEKSLNQKAVDALLGASNVIRQAKDAGQSVEEFVQQSGLFGDIDPDVAAMAVFIAKNNRSAKRMGEAFKAMATFIKGEIQRRQTGDMFGDNEPVDFKDIVAAANRELERMYGAGVETIGLFDRPEVEALASDPTPVAAPAAAPAAEVTVPDAPDPEPEFDPVAAVNAAYTFDKATDEFKAELAQSLDDEDYSPFATAREFDQAVKSHGGTVSWALVPGAILDSAAAHGADDDEDDWGDVSDEWDDAAGELVTDGVLILDGDFAGHPFRGNQHRRAKMQTHHAARASREAKRADRRAAGHDRVLQYAHSSAAHAHKQAAKGAAGKTKAYHARMAAFHAKRAKHHEDKVDGKPVMDSVSADLLLDSAWPDADMVILDGVGGDIQGVIRKGARVLGRAVIGNDGKGMVYTGSKGSTRVTNPSGARAIWGEYPSVMVEGLFGAAPAPKKPTVKSKPMDEPMNQTTAPESATAPAIDTDRAYLQAIIANEIAVTDDVMARVEAMAATHASHSEMMALIEKAVDVIQAIVITQAQSAMGGKG